MFGCGEGGGVGGVTANSIVPGCGDELGSFRSATPPRE